MTAEFRPDERLRTGVSGLDDVLGGGFPARRVYLIQGDPGAGKTTLCLQFLLAGQRAGERTLFVSLSESREELEHTARSHGWSLEGVRVLEIPSDGRGDDADSTFYTPSEVELGRRMEVILREVDQLRPTRLVLDSCSELRLLAEGPLRYRRQILALKHRLAELGCTILLIDNPQPDSPDMLLQSLVHGVLNLEQLSPLYGAERRRLRVSKLRGIRYRGGYHDFTIRTGGVQVFPRLVAAEHHAPFERGPVPSGVPALDALLGGGPDRGSSLLLIGPSGAGKSSVASRYVLAAAERGERAAVFAFDESAATFRTRAASLRLGYEPHLSSGRVALRQVDPAELAPGEFSHAVREEAEAAGARVIVIDSLNGYLNAMPEERFLALQLHELLMYLGQLGVLTILAVAQTGLSGAQGESPVDVSYLADAVLLFRYARRDGRTVKTLSVVKKRSGPHTTTLHELDLAEGLRLGPALERPDALEAE